MTTLLAVALCAATTFPNVGEPTFPTQTFRASDYGARADGSDSTEAFRLAIAACAAAGGGHVTVPAGTYFTGPIHLKSNVDFHLDDGAVLDFSDNPKDFLPAVPSSWEGLECWNYSPLVYAYGCTNVALTGRGCLRPRMARWKAAMEESKTDIDAARALLYKWGSEDYPVEKRVMPEASAAVMRPQLVQFNRSKGVLVEGVHIRESPFWTIHLFLCEDVVVRNVDVDAHGFNNDGIDIEMTRNVLVDGGVFSAGDDGFVFKAGRNRDGWRIGVPTENVLVRNAHVRFAHSLLCVGSEMSAGVRNVRVENCRVDDCYRLFFVKTNARRGGFVDGISLRDVRAGKVDRLLQVDTDVLYQWRKLPTYEERITRISDLGVENVEVGLARSAVALCGDGRNPIDGVTLRNVAVKRTTEEPVSVRAARNVDLAGLRIGARSSPRCGGFADGERVAFVGDSITHHGWYEVYLQLFQGLRRPGGGTRIMNIGISGDSAAGGNARLEKDVLAMKPDRAFVMFGMNDVGRDLYARAEPADAREAEARAARLAAYRDAQRRLADGLAEAGVETALMTPTPYDQYGGQAERNFAGCNEPGLSDCASVVRELARERRLDLVELHMPLTQTLKTFPEARFCADRVHPDAAGHLLVAAQILGQLNVTSTVAAVTLDASSAKAVATFNAKVNGLRRMEDGLSFSYAPASLPFPRCRAYETAERFYQVTDRLNREMLQVSHLAAGTYDLAFDGEKVGSFTADDLAKGVNLALLDTPNQKRARGLLPAAEALQRTAQRRRQMELVRLRLREAGVDPRDDAAARAWIDRWLAEREAAKAKALSVYRGWADTYREWSRREGELASDEESARARIDAVRPAVSHVTLTRISPHIEH